MLSNSHHTNHSIHLGNYEEFFLLYMDNELDEGQVKMVEDFLSQHPDLRTELDFLLNTKLPAEEITLPKGALLASSMKLNAMEEDILLYLDDELPETSKIKFEQRLVADEDLSLQYQVFRRTKLAAEKITYPHKKELYRHTENVIGVKTWLRIAAIFLLFVSAGVFLLVNRGSFDPQVVTTVPPKQTDPANRVEQIIVNKTVPVQTATVQPPVKKTINNNRIQKKNESKVITGSPDAIKHDQVAIQRKTAPVEHKETFNTAAVTSSFPDRTTNIIAASLPVQTDVAIAPGENQKGSVKGFLRKATRVIEKRTGIDPTNDKEEILIGVLAIKLN